VTVSSLSDQSSSFAWFRPRATMKVAHVLPDLLLLELRGSYFSHLELRLSTLPFT
jgi:hypothetical protein